MLRIVSGHQARADSMITSVASRGSLSGLTGQTPKPISGRRRNSSSLPEMTVAISMSFRTS